MNAVYTSIYLINQKKKIACKMFYLTTKVFEVFAKYNNTTYKRTSNIGRAFYFFAILKRTKLNNKNIIRKVMYDTFCLYITFLELYGASEKSFCNLAFFS